MRQLDSEALANQDITSLLTVLTDTPDASVPTLCQALVYLGLAGDLLNGDGGYYSLKVTVGGQTIEPSPQTMLCSTATRISLFTTPFPVPANEEVVVSVLSPNAGDSSVGTQAYLYEVSGLQPTTLGRQITVESDGDVAKVNALDGHTVQTADNNTILAHADYGLAKLVRSTTPANTLSVDANHLVAVPDTQKVDVNTLKTRAITCGAGVTVGVYVGSTAAASIFNSASDTVDVGKISGDSNAADNLELTYDGTGYSDDYAPATQAQIGNLTSGTAAINTVCKAANDGFVITTGTDEANDEDSTHQLDGITHDLEDVGDTTDCYYIFSVGGNGVPVSITWNGYANAQGDSYAVYAWNWALGVPAWEQVGSIAGASGSTVTTETFVLTNAHVGTGVNIGLVHLRFYSTDGAKIATDRIVCSYAVVAQSVGYAGGAVWVKAAGTSGTTNYVHGTADNPCPWADALVIAASMGLNKFYIANGETVTLSASLTNITMEGHEWSLALGSQAITDCHFVEANVSGISSGTGSHFVSCNFDTSTVGECSFFQCGFTGTITLLASGDYVLHHCLDTTPSTTANPIFVFAADVVMGVRKYSGGIELNGLAATNVVTMDGSGRLIFSSNCTGGTVTLRGFWADTNDNVDGGFLGTLTEVNRYDLAQINTQCDTALTDYGANTTVPDAAGVVATALGNLETHGDSTWSTATGFSTHDAAAVYTAFGTGGNLTTCATAIGFSTHAAADVVTALGTGSTLTDCATATGFATPTNITAATGVSLAADQAVNVTKWKGTVPADLTDTNKVQVSVQHQSVTVIQQSAKMINNVFGVVYFVATTGNDGNDGLTPATTKLSPKTVIEAASAGDFVVLGPGTFALGNNGIDTPDGVTVTGSGIGVTIITSTYVTGSIVRPPSNARVTDLTIYGLLTDDYQIPFGIDESAGEAAFTNATGERLHLIAATDGYFPRHTSATSARLIDCIIDAEYDGVNIIFGQHTLTMIGCLLRIIGPCGVAGDQVIHGINNKSGTVDCVDTNIIAINGEDTTYGICVSDGATTRLHNCGIYTASSGGDEYSVYSDDGSLAVLSRTRYDKSLTGGGGTITDLSTFDASEDEVTTDSASRTASKATGFSTHAAADVVTALSTGSTLTDCLTATSVTVTGGTVTTLTNLPSIPADWITAAGIATGAFSADAFAADALVAATFATSSLDGKGDWNTIVPDVGGTAATLHGVTDGKLDTVDGIVDSILEDTNELQTNQGNWVTGDDAGTGARTVAVTVNDGTDALESAKVRFNKGADSYIQTTDASGEASFSLDDGTWAVVITLGGYTFTSTTLVVDGDEDETYSMTAVSVPASDPDKVTGYFYTYDEDGDVESGVTIGIRFKSLSGTGIVYDRKVRELTSDANGLVTITNLFPGAKYEVRRLTNDLWTEITVATTATTPYVLTSFWGVD